MRIGPLAGIRGDRPRRPRRPRRAQRAAPGAAGRSAGAGRGVASQVSGRSERLGTSEIVEPDHGGDRRRDRGRDGRRARREPSGGAVGQSDCEKACAKRLAYSCRRPAHRYHEAVIVGREDSQTRRFEVRSPRRRPPVGTARRAVRSSPATGSGGTGGTMGRTRLQRRRRALTGPGTPVRRRSRSVCPTVRRRARGRAPAAWLLSRHVPTLRASAKASPRRQVR